MKKALFIIGIAIVVLAAGFSGCGGDGIPTIEVTGPQFETITFQNGDITLAGTLDLPAGEGLFPAIVTIHGSPPLTRNDWYNLYISHFFVQHGFAVLRYDKMKNHDLIDPNMIGVAGFSQGGWIAPHAASKSHDVAFAIALSGPTCSVGQEIYYSDLVEGDNRKANEISLTDASDMARDYTGPSGFDPLPSLQKIDAPCLWVLGEKDSSIPVLLTVEILDSLVTDHDKDFSYIIYPNANHGLVDEDTGAYYPFLLDTFNWLNEKFGD